MPGRSGSGAMGPKGQGLPPEPLDIPLGPSLQENLQALKGLVGGSDDLQVREFRLGPRGAVRAAAVFVEGLVEQAAVDDFVLRSLTLADLPGGELHGAAAMARIREVALHTASVTEAFTLGQTVYGILNGRSAVLVDGCTGALLAGTTGWKMRQMSESAVEGVVRGSREAFTEDLTTGISAVRRRIRHPRLRVQRLELGDLTRTRVAILYIEGLARAEVLAEVRSRLASIRIDGILESGYIEELIEDHRWSPFPQIEHTERPDKVAGVLLEGRVAILTDGTPVALLVPTTFFQFLQSAEDYYERFPIAMSIRWLRIVGMVAALYLPAFYVAIITYHQEMIPVTLALGIAGSREGIPFPAFVEALILEVSFELLREAGLRLPRPVGQAVSIVGGLVIGDAAVRAGLVAPPMVVVVASTGIASFSIPAFNVAVTFRLLRFANLVIGAFAGLPGLALSGLALLCHMASLRSFGVPYLSPLTPGDVRGWKDTLLRAPWWALRQRPAQTAAVLPRMGSGGKGRRRGG